MAVVFLLSCGYVDNPLGPDYIKASNTRPGDMFGSHVCISGDGSTLAVGAPNEDSSGTNQYSDTAPDAGAVYVFIHDSAGAWSQQAYVKAAAPIAGERFGHSVSLSYSGNALAVGTSGGEGIHVFARDPEGHWAQEDILEAPHPDADDHFGWTVALSGNGNTLVGSAPAEDSNATGVGGDPADDTASDTGAVHVFVRDETGTWTQQAYVKSTAARSGDHFGQSVGLSGDGNTLVVSALRGNTVDVFVRDSTGDWSEQARLPVSDAGEGDQLVRSLAVSGEGNVVAIGAPSEDDDSGAVYIFGRDAGNWFRQSYGAVSSTRASDYFGFSVSLDWAGSALAVGTPGDASGVVHLLVETDSEWQTWETIRAPTDAEEYFGQSVSLSGRARTLAIGAPGESSNATGVDGNQDNGSAPYAGAAYRYALFGAD